MKRLGYLTEFFVFLKSLSFYFRRRFYHSFYHFEGLKDWLVDKLYKQRGRWARPFEHLSFAGLVIIGFLLWAYLSSMILLMGAEFTAQHTNWRQSGRPVESRPPHEWLEDWSA